ncbi:hypothetical protein AMECASPLE_038697 [Ameca splendens]|uniref:Uncharacterized protein n=1 Tax=Ameca splendens TaxID=208324 RepID=A0ABV1AFI3_9TELE
MSSRRRPAGGVKSVQGDPCPSGTTKKRVSRKEEINQRRSRRTEEIRSHQKQRQENGAPQRHRLASLLMMVTFKVSVSCEVVPAVKLTLQVISGGDPEQRPEAVQVRVAYCPSVSGGIVTLGF